MNKWIAERATQRKAEASYRRAQISSEAARFYQERTTNAKQQQKWQSPQSYNKSMRSFERAAIIEAQKDAIAVRRQKLQAKLSSEDSSLAKELSAVAPTKLRQIDKMRLRSQDLKSARETERKAAATERLKQRLFDQDSELRDLDREQATIDAQERLNKQVAEKRVNDAREADEKKQIEAVMEEDRRRQDDRQNAIDAAAREEEKHHATALVQQIKDLERRDADAERLRREHTALEAELFKAFAEEEAREKRNQQVRMVRYGRRLQQQHKAMLQRQALEIEEQLQEDYRMLEELERAEEIDRKAGLLAQSKAQSDVAWMKEDVARQIETEAARKLEIEKLYQEEAQRLWAKQERVWEREKQARENLMRKVLKERQDQVQEKLALLERKQQQSIDERAALLNLIDESNAQTVREEVSKRDAIEERRRELDSQVLMDALYAKRAEKERLQREAREKEADEAAADMIREERRRRSERPYAAPQHGRVPTSRTDRGKYELAAEDINEVQTKVQNEYNTIREAASQIETPFARDVFSAPPRFGRKRVAWD